MSRPASGLTFASFKFSKTSIILALLLSISHLALASEPELPANKSTNSTLNETSPCEFKLPSGSDVFGAGVRISFYINWLASFITIWYDNKESGSMRTSTNILSIAIMISQAVFKGGDHIKTLFTYKPDRVSQAELWEAIILANLTFTMNFFVHYPLVTGSRWFSASRDTLSWACMNVIAGVAVLGLAVQIGVFAQGNSEKYRVDCTMGPIEKAEELEKPFKRSGFVDAASGIGCGFFSILALCLFALSIGEFRKHLGRSGIRGEKPAGDRNDPVSIMDEDECKPLDRRPGWHMFLQCLSGCAGICIIEVIVTGIQDLDAPTDSLGQILALVTSIVTLCTTLKRCLMPHFLKWIQRRKRNIPVQDSNPSPPIPLLQLNSSS